jgi:hypothetical protein
MAGLFECWTPAERWLAGLLWADGHLRPNVVPGNDKIILSQTDPGVVAAAIAIVGEDHQVRVQEPRKPTHRPCYYVDFTDRSDELFRLGMEMKVDRRWPGEIASASFVRGLFDGDGSVMWRQSNGSVNWCLRSVLDGPAAVLEGARGWLADQGVPPRNLNRHGNSWRIAWHHADSRRLAEIMYSEAGPCMTRKRDCFRRQEAP